METNPLCVPATLAVVINSMPALKDKLLVATLAVTSCKLSNVLQMKVADVDTDNKLLRRLPGIGNIQARLRTSDCSSAVSLKNPVGELFLNLFKEYLRTQPTTAQSADRPHISKVTVGNSTRIHSERHYSVTEASHATSAQSGSRRETDGQATFTPHAFRRMVITAQARATLMNISDGN